MYDYTGKGKGWSQFIQWIIDGEGAIRVERDNEYFMEGLVRFPDGQVYRFEVMKATPPNEKPIERDEDDILPPTYFPARGDLVSVMPADGGKTIYFGREVIFPATF